MENIKITTRYFDLPSDTKSALAELNSLLCTGLAVVSNPDDFVGDPLKIARQQLNKANKLVQKMLC